MSEKKVMLDELDKNIMKHMTRGFYSYEELAEKLQVTRSTVYRRINKLEKMHVISKRIMAVPDFAKLDMSAICIGMNVAYEDLASAVSSLVKLDDVKLVWKTYGKHNLIVVIVCERGCEGRTIYGLREKLDAVKIEEFDVSIGFSWEKVDFSPY